MLTERAKIEKERLNREIEKMEQKLKDAPDGAIHCYQEGNSFKWFHTLPDGKGRKKRVYIPKSQKEFAKQLAMKAYLLKRLNDCKNERRALEAYLKRTTGTNGQVSALLKKAGYAELLPRRDADKQISEWVKEPYERNPRHPEHLTIKAANGMMVRSKSEAFILSALETNNIPFRYECRLQLGELVCYPDFTIMHPVTGKIMIWEHFGMMGDSHYASKAYDKIRMYMKYGYYPMDNLITTFEDESHPLDLMHVQDIVESLR